MTTRSYAVVGATSGDGVIYGVVYVNETATRSYVMPGIYVNETVAVSGFKPAWGFDANIGVLGVGVY